MSAKTASSFRQIGAPLDVDDASLDRINAALDVPTMSKASAPRPMRAKQEKLTLEVPGYLADELKRRALDQRTTVRHAVMLALQQAGFEVADADLVPDGRRTRER